MVLIFLKKHAIFARFEKVWDWFVNQWKSNKADFEHLRESNQNFIAKVEFYLSKNWIISINDLIMANFKGKYIMYCHY